MHDNIKINWDKAKTQKISVRLHGHATSFSLERPFYKVLQRKAANIDSSLTRLIEKIDSERPKNISLSSALRLYVLEVAKNETSSEDIEH